MRLPDMPIGWPRAMAPPLTLDDLGGDAERRHRGDTDGGEGLVQLEQVDVAHGEAGPAEGELDGVGGLVEQRRVGAGHLAVAEDAAERLDAELLGRGLRATITAAPPSEICDALPAVMLPALSNAGRSAPSDSAVVPARTPSSSLKRRGSPLRWGISTLTISASNRPSFWARAARSCDVAASSSCAIAGDACALRVLLGAGAHGDLVDGAEQAVVHHRVDQGTVAHAVALTGLGQQVGRLGHRLHAAGHDDVGLARLDVEIGEVDGVDAREAHLVDGGGRDAERDAGVDRRLAGCHLAGAGQQHLAHEDVVDLLGREPGPLERGRDGEAAELGRLEPGERTRELADGRPCAREDHRTSHTSSRKTVCRKGNAGCWWCVRSRAGSGDPGV